MFQRTEGRIRSRVPRAILSGRCSAGPAIARRTSLAGLTLLAGIALGCGGEGLTSPAIEETQGVSRPAPFSVQLRVHELDQLSDARCVIRVIADARGGPDGTYAEWELLRGSSFDPVTREFIGVSRTRPLYPDVFPADRIEAGESQQGLVNLELYRRDAGQQVIVELEFVYEVGREGSADHQEGIARISHSCQ